MNLKNQLRSCKYLFTNWIIFQKFPESFYLDLHFLAQFILYSKYFKFPNYSPIIRSIHLKYLLRSNHLFFSIHPVQILNKFLILLTDFTQYFLMNCNPMKHIFKKQVEVNFLAFLIHLQYHPLSILILLEKSKFPNSIYFFYLNLHLMGLFVFHRNFLQFPNYFLLIRSLR
jgi:hypothetical protein